MWHAIIALGLHIRSDDTGCGMPIWTLGSKNTQTTSRVTCHSTWEAQKVEPHRALHDIFPLDSTHGREMSTMACHQHPWTTHTIRLNQARHSLIVLGQHTRSDEVGRGIPSSPLENIHDLTMLDTACYDHPLTTETIGPRRMLHDRMALGIHTR